jgi:predicted alpha/beta superfamily hydrolase
LFSLYVIHTEPELFTKYYAGSSPISFANSALYRTEKEFALCHDDLNATLFMTIGGLEDPTWIADIHHMADLLIQAKMFATFKLKIYSYEFEFAKER